MSNLGSVPLMIPAPLSALTGGKTMIVDSFGRYVTQTVHDHERDLRGGVEEVRVWGRSRRWLGA
jgi:hypothetical protein